MSSRNNPFEELERLFERMSRQFEEVSRSWSSESPMEAWATDRKMAVDLVEHDDEFVVTVDLPGFERDDVDIRITDHTLRISADRDQEIDEGDEEYIRHERKHRSASRSIRLPGAVSVDDVDARMRNGVLTVTLPREEAEDVRHIEVE